MLRTGASVSGAADAIGVSRAAIYKCRANDTEFAASWEDAVEHGTDRLEDVALQRAVDGVEEPIFYQGQQIASVRKRSDSLLLALLRARRPERFREQTKPNTTTENLGSFIAQSFGNDQID